MSPGDVGNIIFWLLAWVSAGYLGYCVGSTLDKKGKSNLYIAFKMLAGIGSIFFLIWQTEIHQWLSR